MLADHKCSVSILSIYKCVWVANKAENISEDRYNSEDRFPNKGSLVPVENRSARDYTPKLIRFHFERKAI